MGKKRILFNFEINFRNTLVFAKWEKIPPTGFHGLIGLTVSSRLSVKRANEKIAFFFGSVFPDLDIFGSIVIFLVGFVQGKTISELRDPVIQFHRSFTHSIFLIMILFLFGLFIHYSSFERISRFGPVVIAF